jgi:hypothetical protein
LEGDVKKTPRQNLRALWHEVDAVDTAYLQGNKEGIKATLRRILALGQEMLEEVEKSP